MLSWSELVIIPADDEIVFRVGWSKVEKELLRQCVKKYTFGNFEEYSRHFPTRNRQHVYGMLQKLRGKQAVRSYVGMHLDLMEVRRKNMDAYGCAHYVRKKFGSSKLVKLERFFTIWKYQQMHCQVKEKTNEYQFLQYYDVEKYEGLRSYVMKLRSGKDLNDIYPPVVKHNVDVELLKWEKKLIEARDYYAEKRMLINYLDEISHELKEAVKLGQLDNFDVSDVEYKFIKKAYWIQIASSIKIVQDARSFLENNQEIVDVVLMDPPYSWCGPNPTRGPANQFGTLSDYEIIHLTLGKPVKNTLIAVWNIMSKRNVVLEIFKQQNIEYLDRIVWIKTMKVGKLRSSLVPLTQKCTEELIFGKVGEFPETMLSMNFGKECVLLPVLGNCRMPRYFKELIDSKFKKGAKK
eukprot:augustus_masked-scaffold_104-processed-gene-0.2-mRNA-1 protein AED:1.00 eAED:1.00 QI:0/0/0/0/1/1/2/0/406